MKALLAYLEKTLAAIFLIGLGALIVVGLLRCKGKEASTEDEEPWKQAKAEHSLDGYMAYLRQCQSCPHEAEAEKALDEAQKTRGLVARLARGHMSARTSIALPAFSPDGRTILASDGAGLDFWNALTGERLPRSKDAFPIRGGRYIESLAWSADGNRIAAGMSGTENGNLLVWERKNGTLVGDYFVEDYDVEAVAFAQQNSLVGWLAHGPAGVWEPDSGRFLRGTHEGASALAFYRNKERKTWMLTASGRELWFWDPATMELAKQTEIKSERTLLGLSQDGRWITYYEGPVLELWDTSSGAPIATLPHQDNEVMSFCRDTAKGWAVTGTKTGNLYLWNPASTDKPLALVPAHEGPVEQVSCSGNGRVASVGWDSVKIWDLEKLRGWQERQQKAGRHSLRSGK